MSIGNFSWHSLILASCLFAAASMGCGLAVLLAGHWHAPTITANEPTATSPRPYSKAVEIAYIDGWQASSRDAWTIQRYHNDADDLPDDSDPEALALVWKECVKEALAMEAQWDAQTYEQKLAARPEPFWKSGKGEPRRISRKARAAVAEALSGGAK